VWCSSTAANLQRRHRVHRRGQAQVGHGIDLQRRVQHRGNLLLNGSASVPMDGQRRRDERPDGLDPVVRSSAAGRSRPGATLNGWAAAPPDNKAMRWCRHRAHQQRQHRLELGNRLSIADGAHIVNNGVHEFQGNAGLFYSGTVAGGYTNHGLIVKTGGTGVTSLGDWTNWSLVNHGVIDVQVGTLRLPTPFANDGVLKGNGTLQSSGGSPTGTVAPGSSGIGTLALSSTLTQAAGGVAGIDLTSRSYNDLLNISGSAVLDGTLALSMHWPPAALRWATRSRCWMPQSACRAASRS
jgi:hypothetical protein